MSVSHLFHIEVPLLCRRGILKQKQSAPKSYNLKYYFGTGKFIELGLEKVNLALQFVILGL